MTSLLQRQFVRSLHASSSVAAEKGPGVFYRTFRSLGLSVQRGITGAGKELPQEVIVKKQLSLMYEAIDKKQKYSLDVINNMYYFVMVSKGFEGYIRKNVLWFMTKRSEEYKDLDKKFKVFDGLSPQQRVYFWKIMDKDIVEIARDAEVEPQDVWMYLQEAKTQKLTFAVLKRRRRLGYIDIGTSAELSWIQSAPYQCWKRGSHPMKNPWQKREPPPVSKYAG